MPQNLLGTSLTHTGIPPFYFRITNKLSTQPSWRQRCKKDYPFNTESLNVLAFFPINSEIFPVNPKLVIPTPSNSSFLHLETTNPPICSRIFSSLNAGRTLARFPNKFSKYSGSLIPYLKKKTLMVLLQCHPIKRVTLIDDMDLCDFIQDTSPTLTPPSPIIENKFSKEWDSKPTFGSTSIFAQHPIPVYNTRSIFEFNQQHIVAVLTYPEVIANHYQKPKIPCPLPLQAYPDTLSSIGF